MLGKFWRRLARRSAHSHSARLKRPASRRLRLESLEGRDLLAAGVVVSPTKGLNTTEDGGYAVISVKLAQAPTANVTISLASDNASEGVASASALVFTPENWKASQSFRVTGQPDGVKDGNKVYHVITGAAESDDPSYNGLAVADFTLTNKDSKKLLAGVTVSKTSGLTTTENGGTAAFTIKLNYKPTSEVSIAIASDNPAEGIVSVSSVVFTPDNWNQPQTVTVTGQSDGIKDGTRTYHVLTGPAVSADPLYSGMTVPDVTLKNKDNKAVAGIVVTPTQGLRTDEMGGIASFNIVLTSKPTANVTIPLSSTDPAEGVPHVGSITFTPSDWNQKKEVLVLGQDDGVVDADTPYSIVTGSAVSADPLYSNRESSDVAVVNRARKDVRRFDGMYIGRYTGTARVTTPQGTFTTPVSGSIVAQIINGIISVNVTDDASGQGGEGTGTVASTGATGFGLSSGSVAGSSFSGTFSEPDSSNRVAGKGFWQYSANGVTASGPWTATRQ